MRPLHRDLHFERSRSRGSEGIQDGGRSRLHEMHGLHQRLPERRLVFRFWKTDGRGLKPKSKPIPRNYSLTWPEEIIGAVVFLGSFLAVRGVYALVPFLMALGCAAVTTFLALKTLEIAQDNRTVLSSFQLEILGKNSNSGMGISSLLDFCGWLERAQWVGSLSRISKATARFKNPDPRRAGAGPDKSRSLAWPDRPGEHPRGEKTFSDGFGLRTVRQWRGASEARLV